MRNTINNYTVDKRVKFTKGLRGGLGRRVDRWGNPLTTEQQCTASFSQLPLVQHEFRVLNEKARVLTHRVYGTSGCWAIRCPGTVKLVLRLDVYDSTETEETIMITEAARQGCTRSVWWVDGGTTSVKNLFAINHSPLGGGTLHYSLCD